MPSAALRAADCGTTDDFDRRAKCVPELVREHAAETPDAPAIVPGRCPEMIAGALAICKPGATYLPLDASYPSDRIGFIVPDAQCPLRGMLALLRHPEELARLRAGRSPIASAIEELLRYGSPSQQTARLAPEDLLLGDKTIGTRHAVIAVMSAANRDPDPLPAPTASTLRNATTDTSRSGADPISAFGAALARIEGQVAFETLLRRLPGLALPAPPHTWRINLGLRGLTVLPLTVRRPR
jgi:hypothetical protein